MKLIQTGKHIGEEGKEVEVGENRDKGDKLEKVLDLKLRREGDTKKTGR